MTNETNEIIFGKNSVMEALIAGDREINKILISKNIHSDNKLNKIILFSSLLQKKNFFHTQNLITKELLLKFRLSNTWT